MMPKDPLPPTDVGVTTDSPAHDHHRFTITAKRPGDNADKEKAWTGEAQTVIGAAKEAVKKLFDDPTSAEYIRKG